jgi:hypothetical protein
MERRFCVCSPLALEAAAKMLIRDLLCSFVHIFTGRDRRIFIISTTHAQVRVVSADLDVAIRGIDELPGRLLNRSRGLLSIKDFSFSMQLVISQGTEFHALGLTHSASLFSFEIEISP